MQQGPICNQLPAANSTVAPLKVNLARESAGGCAVRVLRRASLLSSLALVAIVVLALSLTPSALAAGYCTAVNYGVVGVAFDSGPMTVSGGTAPYTYSVVGTLPASLTLNTSTGEVTGTPTATGTFSIQVDRFPGQRRDHNMPDYHRVSNGRCLRAWFLQRIQPNIPDGRH